MLWLLIHHFNHIIKLKRQHKKHIIHIKLIYYDHVMPSGQTLTLKKFWYEMKIQDRPVDALFAESHDSFDAFSTDCEVL